MILKQINETISCVLLLIVVAGEPMQHWNNLFCMELNIIYIGLLHVYAFLVITLLPIHYASGGDQG